MRTTAQIFWHHTELYHAAIGTTVSEQRRGAGASEAPEVGTKERGGESRVAQVSGRERRQGKFQ
jgi:hypothetical protein